MHLNLEDVAEEVLRRNLRALAAHIDAVFDAEDAETGTKAVANCYGVLLRVTLAASDVGTLRGGYRSIYQLATDCADSMHATAQRTKVYGAVKRFLEEPSL